MDILQTHPDLDQGKELFILQGHEDYIILFEQDYDNSHYIISVSNDNVIIIWNITTNQKIFQSTKFSVNILSIGLQYPRIAYGNSQDGIVKLFDINNADEKYHQIMAGSELLPMSWQLKFRKNNLFSYTSGNIVVVWDIQNNQKLRTYKFLNFIKQIDFVSSFLLVTTVKGLDIVCHQRNKKLFTMSEEAYPLSTLLYFTKSSNKTIKFLIMKKLIKKTNYNSNNQKIVVTLNNLLLFQQDQTILLNIPTLQQSKLSINGQLIIYKDDQLYVSKTNNIMVLSQKGL